MSTYVRALLAVFVLTGCTGQVVAEPAPAPTDEPSEGTPTKHRAPEDQDGLAVVTPLGDVSCHLNDGATDADRIACTEGAAWTWREPTGEILDCRRYPCVTGQACFVGGAEGICR